MNSLIAFVLCAVFIVFLLRLDRRQFPDASSWLWLPTVWMVLVAGRSLNFYLGAHFGEEMDGGTTLDGLFQLFLVSLGSIALKKRKVKWGTVFKENPWVFILIGYMLISISWSGIVFVAFKRWIRQFVAVVMAVVVSTEAEPRLALEAVIRRAMYFAIPVSILLVYFYPHLGVTDLRSGDISWSGITSHRNGLGRLSCFALFYLYWKLWGRWKDKDKAVTWYHTYIELSLLLLALNLFTGPNHSLTYSATSTATLAVGIIGFSGLSWLKRRGKIVGAGTLLGIVTFFLIYTLITPFVGGLSIIDVSELLNRSETLTGRLYNWLDIIPYVMETPLLGRGFGGTWWHRNPHNSPLTIILNMGCVGLLFFNMFLLTSCMRVRREMLRDFEWGAFWTCLLVMGTIHGISERSMVHFGTQWPAVLLFFYVYERHDAYRQKNDRKKLEANGPNSQNEKSRRARA
jgi:O-antigen ligase